MVDFGKGDDTKCDRDRFAVDRRRLLQATAAAGVFSGIGQVGAADGADDFSTTLPDVTLVNLTDDEQEVDLSLDSAEGVTANTATSNRITVPEQGDTTVSLTRRVTQAQSVSASELGETTLQVRDDRGSASLDLDTIGTANVELDVVVEEAGLRIEPLYIDPGVGGGDTR